MKLIKNKRRSKPRQILNGTPEKTLKGNCDMNSIKDSSIETTRDSTASPDTSICGFNPDPDISKLDQDFGTSFEPDKKTQIKTADRLKNIQIILAEERDRSMNIEYCGTNIC